MGDVVLGVGPGQSSRGRPVRGHDPQSRVGQATDHTITVNDRIDVAHHAARTDPGKGTLAGPSDSRATHHAANNANPAVTNPRPATTTLTGGSGGDDELGAGDVRADRGDHLVAEPVVFGVGVIGPVELGVDPVVGDGEVPPTLAQPGIAADPAGHASDAGQRLDSGQGGVELRGVGSSSGGVVNVTEPANDDVADHAAHARPATDTPEVAAKRSRPRGRAARRVVWPAGFGPAGPGYGANTARPASAT